VAGVSDREQADAVMRKIATWGTSA
jgi:hypothetical protein